MGGILRIVKVVLLAIAAAVVSTKWCAACDLDSVFYKHTCGR